MILSTPVREVLAPIRGVQGQVFVKLENLQRTGSFKIRGALNKLYSLSDPEKKRGVIASSAGNHAQGVAFSAQKLGVQCHIVMPESSPLVKVSATQSYGAEVILHGEYYDQAFQKASELAREKGWVFVHPYQDPFVISGQGTIGLEILEQLPEVDTLVIPIGGGGLIGGISMVAKTLKPDIRVIGVVCDAAPGMLQMFRGEKKIDKPIRGTIADGISVKTPSREMYENFISRYVDEIVSVSDDEIATAIVFLIEKMKSVTEGSGAAGFAALLAGKIPTQQNTCVLLTGGNIDLNAISRVIETGLRNAGRLARISVIVEDVPGSLLTLTQVIAEKRANVIDVFHDRVSPDLHMKETRIDFLVETRSIQHLEEITSALKALSRVRALTHSALPDFGKSV